MIERTFDARTLARMNLALDRVCRTVVDSESDPQARRPADHQMRAKRQDQRPRAIARLAHSDRPRLSDNNVSPPDERRSCPSLPGLGHHVA